MEYFTTVLMMIGYTAGGVLLSAWLAPIPWKFPMWERQERLRRIAYKAIITVCLIYVGTRLVLRYLA